MILSEGRCTVGQEGFQEETDPNHADSYMDKRTFCKWKINGEVQKAQMKTLNPASLVKAT